MMTFNERTKEERAIICRAYNFEIKAIEECDTTTNPWFNIIMQMKDGKAVWEGINIAVEMAFNKA